MPVETLRYEADLSALRAALEEIRQGQRDTQEQTKEQTDKLTGHWEHAKDAVGVAVGSMVANFATNLAGKAVEFVGSSIEAASNLGETISKVNQIFGGTEGQALQKWAESSATTMGTSKQQALDAAATFAVFGKSAGLAGGDLASFAEKNAQLASDFASFHNTSPQEAIEAIGAALRGEAEPIRKYGVLLDDATLRNEALKLGLISSTKDALTPAQKALAANAAIMAQAGDATGDFARTSDGLANKQRIMAAEIENAKIGIGEGLLPVQMMLVQAMQSYLVPALTKVGEWLQTVSTYFQEHTGVAKVVAIVIGVALVGAFIAWAASAASAAVATIAATWPVLAIAAAIAALVAGVIYAYNNWDTFRESVQAVGRFLRDTLWPILQTVGGIIADYIVFQVKLAIAYFKLWWEAAQIAYDVIYWALMGIWNIANSVVGWIGDRIGGLGSVMSGVAEVLTSPFRSAFNSIARLWNSTVGALSFTIPDWVPGVGGKGFSVPDIPTFDTGAYVRSPTLAMLSMNRIPEIVAPEPMLRQILREESGGKGNRTVVNNTTNLYGATALTPRDLERAAASSSFRVRVGAS